MDAVRITRRRFAAAAIALPAAFAAAAERSAGTLVFIGREDGAGIRRCRIDGHTGTWSEPTIVAAAIESPSFLALHPTLPVLYAVSEGDAASSALFAFRITPDGGLQPLARVATAGAAPCYIGMHPGSRTAVTANYNGGSLSVFSIGGTGAMHGPPRVFNNATPASNAVPKRQGASHLHCATYAPNGRTLAACDLGTDEVLLFRCDARGSLAQEPRRIAMLPGSGPRHVVFSHDAERLYVVNELACTVAVIDAPTTAHPKLRAGADISTLGGQTRTAATTAAEILLHRSGRRLYTSTRGIDVVTAFDVHADGSLALPRCTPVRGDMPRWIGFMPDGTGVLALNQGSSSMTLLKPGAAGYLQEPQTVLATSPNPTCAVFWPRERA